MNFYLGPGLKFHHVGDVNSSSEIDVKKAIFKLGNLLIVKHNLFQVS